MEAKARRPNHSLVNTGASVQKAPKAKPAQGHACTVVWHFRQPQSLMAHAGWDREAHVHGFWGHSVLATVHCCSQESQCRTGFSYKAPSRKCLDPWHDQFVSSGM